MSCFFLCTNSLRVHSEKTWDSNIVYAGQTPPTINQPEFSKDNQTFDEECGDRYNYKCWKKGGHSVGRHSDCAAPTGITDVNGNGACVGKTVINHGGACHTSCISTKDPSVAELDCNDGVLTPATFTCDAPETNHIHIYKVEQSCANSGGTVANHAWVPVRSYETDVGAASGALNCEATSAAATCYLLMRNAHHYSMNLVDGSMNFFDSSLTCQGTPLVSYPGVVANRASSMGVANTCFDTTTDFGNAATAWIIDGDSHTWPASCA